MESAFDTFRLRQHLFILVCLACAIITRADAKTWVVAAGTNLQTIQSALSVALDGDTIRVMAGHYKEGNLVIRKSIVLIGIDFPVLDGELKYEIFTIVADNVSIIGLKLINTGVASINDISAISAIQSRGLQVIGNQLENTFFGIHLANMSNSIVKDNIITSNARSEHQIGNGIHAWKCDSLLIMNNKVSGHRDGIYFEFVTNSMIESNHSHDNMRYGLHFMFSHNDQYHNNTFQQNGAGVAVMYTQGVTMTGNTFEDNWGASSYGLLLKDIRDTEIRENHFSKNTIGVYMEGSSRCTFTNNVFRENGWAVKIQANCDENEFVRNDFLSNTFDIATNGSLVLNKVDYNYWDNYEGYDLDHDGIGDVAYHPVSLYSMVVEKMPASVMLWRSFLVYLLDRTEKVVPSVTPESLKDDHPLMHNHDRSF